MIERESPLHGTEWLGNARTFEETRIDRLKQAERLEARGDHIGAAAMRTYAAQARRDRDRVQREETDALLNRRARRRF